MRLRFLSAFLLFITVFASGKQEKKEPDAVNIAGNTMEAPFFKLHYTFPPGWSAESDDVRREKNQKSHETAVKLAEAMHAQMINSGVTSTRYFSNYELFMGKREPVPADGNSPEPFILIRASERSGGVLNDAGDTAKFISRKPPAKLLEGPKEQKISGRKFMRSLLVLFQQEANEQFEVMYESVSGNYFLLFEFHAATQKEANELAQSMESVRFDK